MKSKKGITLIALTIIVLLLVILASTSIYFGFRTLYKTQNFRIYSNLSLLYAKIEDISEKHSFNPQSAELIGYELTAEMKTMLTNQGINPNTGSWKFLTEVSLAEMNLPANIKEEETNLIVNYETLEIFYTKGYRKIDGTYTYKYSEMKEIESNESY